MINFENVKKFALSDISLHIPRGQIVGLVGASGVGKTTLVRLASGLLSPESGSVRTLDRDPVVYRKRYGTRISTFISGVPLLGREDTVLQGFELIKSMYQIPYDRYVRDYEELSKRLGFGEYARETVSNLSLGQRMRAELGSALIYRPELLLLDEPNVGLDENGKEALYKLLMERCAAGMTVLMTSHDMTGISKLCSRIALLDSGKLVFYGSEDNLRSCYAPEDVMTVVFAGRLPDLEDLPLKRYSVDGSTLRLFYDSNHITAAEIMRLLLVQTHVIRVSIEKTDLEKIISQLKGRETYGLNRSERGQQDV